MAGRAYQMAAWHPRVIGLLSGVLARMGERERDPTMVLWLRQLLTKPLRTSPRWPKIAAMMNLPETMSQLS